MKNIAYLLIIAGFLLGAYVAALDAVAVDWLLCGIAAITAISGVVTSKRLEAAAARSGALLEANRTALNESIGNIVRGLESLTRDGTEKGAALLTRIDTDLREDLRRFADARESMVHLYGLQAYADIMSEFAAGERYINRVWSSSADGYDEEARHYLQRAIDQFTHAQSQLAAAANA